MEKWKTFLVILAFFFGIALSEIIIGAAETRQNQELHKMLRIKNENLHNLHQAYSKFYKTDIPYNDWLILYQNNLLPKVVK